MKSIYMASTFMEAKITKHPLVKETAKQVVFISYSWNAAGREQRAAKNGSHESFFHTWEEAHSFLLDAAENKVKIAKRNLAHANDKLGNVKGMKNTVD